MSFFGPRPPELWRKVSAEEIIRLLRVIGADRQQLMKRKSTKRLSKEQREDIAALAAMKDSEIDLTDMPEVLDWSGAEIGKSTNQRSAP